MPVLLKNTVGRPLIRLVHIFVTLMLATEAMIMVPNK